MARFVHGLAMFKTKNFEAVQEFFSGPGRQGGPRITSYGAGTASFTAGNTRRVVPVLDAKLGADYTYVFNNAANSDLTLEAGWMVSNYFNAVDRLQTETILTADVSHPPPPSFSQSFQLTGRTTSDFGIQGPYVSLVLHV